MKVSKVVTNDLLLAVVIWLLAALLDQMTITTKHKKNGD